MGTSGLLITRVSRLQHEMPLLEQEITSLTKHLRFLATTGKIVDARLLLEQSTLAMREIVMLQNRLFRVLDEAENTLRSIPKAQPPCLAVGRYERGINASNIRAYVKRLPLHLEEVRKAADALRAKANEAINEPGRWGDLAASNAVNDLVGIAFMFLDLYSAWLAKRRHSHRG